MKFSGKVDNGTMNESLNFSGDQIRDPDPDPDPYLDTIPIRSATLVRRALAEVCTVPVLLV